MTTTLLSKYDIAAPRYTSYPTVPYWTEQTMQTDAWLQRVQSAAERQAEISLYIHLPFCERLCTYCGCNKHITKNHGLEQPYLQAVLQEWRQYRAVLPERLMLSELHLGGGTPTFFQPENLQYLLEAILKEVDLAPDPDFGFEAHPWSTSEAHIRTLAALGFKRISIGVQDFDEDLMALVNRQQSIRSIEQATDLARKAGFESVNYDLIYGLPRQTIKHILADAAHLSRLKPDRIAFYSYAHVPWLKKSQCAYDESDIPQGAAKRALYEIGRAELEALGYLEIGMDHFALPHDRLAQAMLHGQLHRNFMGYTTSRSKLMIGLGASAIGDTWDAFAQNEKNVADYQQRVAGNSLPLLRGHYLNEEDLHLRRHILNLMTRFETALPETDPWRAPALQRLAPMIADGLVTVSGEQIQVQPEGRPFLRNACMAFDAQLWRKQPEGKLFSRSV